MPCCCELFVSGIVGSTAKETRCLLGCGLQDEEDKEDIGVEVMLTAEDAAAGFRLPLPLLHM